MAAPRIDNLNSYNNLIINGNFDYWQRGTSSTVANNVTFFLADRWRVQNTMTSNLTVSRSTDVPTVAQSGFQSAYSMLITNSASPTAPTTSFTNIRYVFEGSDYAPIHGQACRIQFWVKSSVTGTYTVRLGNNDGTRTYLTNITISAASTWEKKTIDLTMDTSGTWLYDNSAGLRLIINLGAPAANQSGTLNTWFTDTNTAFTSTTQTNWASTANATFQLAQVMLVKGSFPSASTSLTFQRAGKTIGEELAMCQRYYYQFSDLASGTRPLARAIWYDAGALYFTIRLPVTMRGDPALVGTAGTDILVYTTSLVLQTGFGANVTANPTRDNVYIACSKGAHGLTDGTLTTTTNTTGLNAEL